MPVHAKTSKDPDWKTHKVTKGTLHVDFCCSYTDDKLGPHDIFNQGEIAYNGNLCWTHILIICAVRHLAASSSGSTYTPQKQRRKTGPRIPEFPVPSQLLPPSLLKRLKERSARRSAGTVTITRSLAKSVTTPDSRIESITNSRIGKIEARQAFAHCSKRVQQGVHTQAVISDFKAASAKLASVSKLDSVSRIDSVSTVNSESKLDTPIFAAASNSAR